MNKKKKKKNSNSANHNTSEHVNLNYINFFISLSFSSRHLISVHGLVLDDTFNDFFIPRDLIDF